MSFNLTIDSNNNINQLNQSPNPLIIDPLLINFYTFEPENLTGNLLQNQGISRAYDLQIDTGVVIDGTLNTQNVVGDISAAKITTNVVLGTTFTIGGWFNADILSNYSRFFSFGIGNNGNNSIELYIFSNQITLYVANSGVAISQVVAGTISINTWYHIAWNVSGTTWTFYLNGTPTTYTGKVDVANKTKTDNYIAKTWAGANLIGRLDGFFVYNGTLSGAQITDIYNKGQQPVQTNYYYTIPIQPYTYTYANNQLQYYFDFTARPPHPYGTNKYKVYSSFISFGTPFAIVRTNQMNYYIIDGLGTFNTFIGRGGNPASTIPQNHLIKNITLKRNPPFSATYTQKWIDLDPTMPMIIENLNETGIIYVEIRLIQNNNLQTNVNTFGAQATSYMINLLFEPVE